MGALPIQIEAKRELPDYLPARMVNEYAYCPRLFFYEWVEGLFAESVDTVEGAIQHRRVDARATGLPSPEEIGSEEGKTTDDARRSSVPQSIHSRSVQLSSERLRVIAKMDLVEVEDGVVTPVDYKHGRPRDGADGLELWPADRAQLGVQGIVLRENGYRCDEGVAYYRKTGQRVRVVFDEALIAETEALILEAWGLAESGEIPAPLVDSPKCPGCSLVGICLPDETWRAGAEEADEPRQLSLFDLPRRKPVKREVRPMMTPRSELRPLYLNTQGARIGKSGAVLQVKDKEKLLQEVRIGEICQVNLMGNVQITTQAVQALCEAEVPVCYFSMGGWFYGITTGVEHEERVPAAESVPAGGAGVFRANDRAAAGGGEDSQSEDSAAAESCGAEAGDAVGDEGDGGAGGGGGVAGGVAGDRGECGAAVLRGVRGDDEAGRGGGDDPAAVRDGRAEPASAERSGERDAVAGVQLAGEGSDGGVLRGGVRPLRGVLSSAAVRTAGAGVGFDGAVSSVDCGFGGVDGGKHGDGDGAGFRASGRRGGADGGREEGVFPGV